MRLVYYCAALLLASAGAARLPHHDDVAAHLTPGATEPRQPPHLPDSYTVNYTFSLPYTARVQQPALSYPVAFYRDAEAGRVRMDTYGSTQVMIAKEGDMFEVVPRIDRLVCLAFRDDGGEQAAMRALPDVSSWAWAGLEALNGEEAQVWQYEARHEGKHVVYKLYMGPDGAAPRRLHMHGTDAISGAHFDEWVVDYTYFEAGPPDPALFKTPRLCQGLVPQEPTVAGRSGAALRWAALAPGVRYRGDAEYDAFLGGHGAARSHRSLAEYERRRDLFRANLAFIRAHNAAPGRTFAMAMNRFGDYSEEEFVALMLPKRAARLRAARSAAATAADAADEVEGGHACGKPVSKLAPHEVHHEALADAARLPAALSWRGTGADGVGVKDQATCGSCWTFAATGAMEGAWWRATGEAVQLSEQQVLDCSWGYRPAEPWANLACDGGDPDAAMGYVVQAGGIALNQDYPYRGQDGYCAANATARPARFAAFARVPRCDDDALREALYSRGPLAISFDASRPSFRFYSSGVYVDTECLYRPDQLDHSMVLVGYGTGPEGDYWEVKNSWSTHWGERGYFRVSRNVRHACGVPADAAYALVS